MADFKAVEKNGVHLITFPAVIDPDEDNLEALFKTWLVSSCDIHVIDLKSVVKIKPTAYRFFVLFNQQLKANQKRLFCMNLNAVVATQLKQDGLSGVFQVIASLQEAERAAKPQKPAAKAHVDVELINPFIDATIKVLDLQASVKAKAGKPYLRKADSALPMEIAGVIALTCREFKGAIAICFPGATFLAIYGGLVGETHTEITDVIEDGAGELLNMIFGQVKSVLNDSKGYNLEKALPTILSGEKLRIHHQSPSPAIILPFESPVGTFHVEISIELT